MTSGSAHQGSVWMEMDASTHYRLENNLRCDVCVVGAGIAGLSTAYLLTRAGYRVFVVDGGMIGGGETGRTSAHLTNVVDERFYRLEELYGESGAQIAAESHAAAIDKIEAIIADEGADCDFERVDGYLFLGNGDTIETLDRELEAAHRAGLTQSERVARIPVNSFDSGPALRFPDQAQFHPIKYVNALAHAIRVKGGKIFTRTHARQITGGSSARVMTTSGHAISADHIVVATNAPINDVVTIHAKQAAYRTYVIAAPIPEGLISPALYWDTSEPYHYVRIVKASQLAGGSPGKTHDLLIVGGEDHKTGQEDDPLERYSRLESWMRFRFPMTGGIEYRWSGQILEPCDKTAFIGRNPGDETNVYIITGQSGNGLTHGTIGGMIISDMIEGRQNAWSEYYDPSRVTARSLKEYAKENLNVVLQLNDWLTRGTVGATQEIEAGSGAIVRRGLHKIAVYRDARGDLHERSAVCPHLGCIVAWNKAEETWDCPCHGSRFDPYGTVINGPANRNLTDTSTTDEHEEDSDRAIRAARRR